MDYKGLTYEGRSKRFAFDMMHAQIT